MMLWAAIFAGTLAACEIALRLSLGTVLGQLGGTGRKAVHVLGCAAISDDWKEKVLPVYAWRILKASLALFGCLLAIAAPVVILAALAAGSLAAGSAELMRPLPLAAMIVVGAGHVLLRRRLG